MRDVGGPLLVPNPKILTKVSFKFFLLFAKIEEHKNGPFFVMVDIKTDPIRTDLFYVYFLDQITTQCNFFQAIIDKPRKLKIIKQHT